MKRPSMAVGDESSGRRASEGTIVSLLQLDPTPIESPVNEDGATLLLPQDYAGSYGEESDEEWASVRSGSLHASTTSGPGLRQLGWGGSAIFYCE